MPAQHLASQKLDPGLGLGSDCEVPVAPIRLLVLAVGALGLLAVAVPHDHRTNKLALISVSAIALRLAAALGGMRAGPSRTQLSLLLGAGTMLT